MKPEGVQLTEAQAAEAWAAVDRANKVEVVLKNKVAAQVVTLDSELVSVCFGDLNDPGKSVRAAVWDRGRASEQWAVTRGYSNVWLASGSRDACIAAARLLAGECGRPQ